MDDIVKHFLTLGGIGAAIQAGKEAKNYTPEGHINWVQVAGRVVVGAGLGMSAAGILVFVPGLSLIAQAGIAAGVVILGQVFFEKIADKFLSKKIDDVKE